MKAVDTIVALATPAGRGGIAVIRISGTKVISCAQAILGQLPPPRQATYLPFQAEDGSCLDLGIAIYFPNPHSFTGEDVLELQGHGGPIVVDRIIQRLLGLGLRMARPGEFSERAFLNDKLDLAQAEAIADLIDASSEQAARAAIRSLQGEFSKQINTLLQALIELRVFVEAAIDFPEEEIDFLNDGKVATQLNVLLEQLQTIQAAAQQGSLLREGMTVVIAGKPNVGKSSLLNALSGRDCAIVTPIAGTTRDILREYIHIDGLPFHIIDTAGLRETADLVEQEGVKRAQQELQKADRILLLLDANAFSQSESLSAPQALGIELPTTIPVTIIRNKIDLTAEAPLIIEKPQGCLVQLSVKTGAGLDLLRHHLKQSVGYNSQAEGSFSARRRHLTALTKTQQALEQGLNQLLQFKAGELLAEELRQAQLALAEITGEFRADDLLGQIFSSFCIGK